MYVYTFILKMKALGAKPPAVRATKQRWRGGCPSCECSTRTPGAPTLYPHGLE